MSVKLHYQSLGNGNPVLILHGLFGSHRNWASIAKRLSENYQVINVDLRNHGNSEHADSMSYPELADDISTVMADLDLKKISIIGHSLGGKVAMTFALQHRKMIHKLVVLDVAPVSYQNEFLPLLESMQRLPLEEISNRKQADSLLKIDIPDPSLRLFLLQNLVQESGSYHWRINLEAIKKGLIDIGGFPAPITVKEYEGDVLFLHGENSDYIQPQHHDIIKKYFSRALINSIKDAGHWLHAEQQEKVLNRIESFLNDENLEEPPSLLYR